MEKAKYLGTHYENGIPYGMYEYLGDSYEVCLNAFYSFKSIPEQHKEAQAFIESRKIKTKTTPGAIPPEKVFDVINDWADGKLTDGELESELNKEYANAD